MTKSKRPARALPNRLDCLTCPTRTLAEWSAIPDDEMCKVRDAKISQSYQRGQFIFAQQQVSPGLFCIASGTVAILKEAPAAGTVFLRLAYEGQTLGYRNHLNRSVCTTSGKALEPCTICLINTDVVNGMLKRNPPLVTRFQEHLAEDLDATETTTVQLASLPVRSRLAHLLVALSERYATKRRSNGMEMRPPMTWRDMSELIYTRPETLTRTIQAMENEGVFRHKGHSILIPEFDALVAEIQPR